MSSAAREESCQNISSKLTKKCFSWHSVCPIPLRIRAKMRSKVFTVLAPFCVFTKASKAYGSLPDLWPLDVGWFPFTYSTRCKYRFERIANNEAIKTSGKLQAIQYNWVISSSSRLLTPSILDLSQKLFKPCLTSLMSLVWQWDYD